MKKVFYCFIVGMMFLSSLVASGVTIDNNDTPTTEKDNFGAEYIPRIGTFHIYVWDPDRYDVELDDNHEDIYNWTTTNKTKEVRFDIDVHNDINDTGSTIVFWRIREWLRPPFAFLTYFLSYTGDIRVKGYNERRRMIGHTISWNESGSYEDSFYVTIEIQNFNEHMQCTGFIWGGLGSQNWDFSVLHLHFP